MALIHLSRSSNRCRCSAWIPILLPQHHCSPQAAPRSTLDKKLLYPNNEFSTKFQFYQTYLIHQIGSEAASLSSLWRWSIFSLLFMFFYHFFHFPLKFWFSKLLLFNVHAICFTQFLFDFNLILLIFMSGLFCGFNKNMKQKLGSWSLDSFSVWNMLYFHLLWRQMILVPV